MQIIVEGWRFLCHSYSVINQFILRELWQRSDVELFHLDRPYIDDNWQTDVNLKDREMQVLYQIPSASSHQKAEVTFKIYCPWNFHRSKSEQTWVFALTEWGIINKIVLDGIGVNSIRETPVNSQVMVLTSSQWSKQGLIRSGIHEDRIKNFPLGFAPSLYYPLSQNSRKELRKNLGWDDYFIFFNAGGCNPRKGIRLLLKSFAIMAQKYPHVRLYLKGSELLYPSWIEIQKGIKEVLTDSEQTLVKERILYDGRQLSYQQIAQLYQAADAYISPYLAEGFNLPVLEASACGLPIICTQGGPTDEFTHNNFAMKIESITKSISSNSENLFILLPNLDHLISLMENMIENSLWREQARNFSPGYVRQYFTWEKVTNQLLNIFQNPSHYPNSLSSLEFF